MSALGSAAVYSTQEFDRLLEAIAPASRRRMSPTSIRMRALVLLMRRTGMRVSEALSLELRDLGLDSTPPTLRIREGKTNAASRMLGIAPDAFAALHVWLGQRRNLPGDRVFCTLKGAPMHDSYVRAYLSRKGKQADIKRCHSHGLRASLAVQLAHEGRPMPVIRDVLGHANLASTDAYLRRTFAESAVLVTAGVI